MEIIFLVSYYLSSNLLIDSLFLRRIIYTKFMTTKWVIAVVLCKFQWQNRYHEKQVFVSFDFLNASFRF